MLRGGGTPDDKLKTIFEYIEESEYDIREASEGRYNAANRATNLRFTMESSKFSVEPRDFGRGNPKPWEVTFEFEGAAKGGHRIAVSTLIWKVNGKAASASDTGISIEYLNDRNGLRQSFLVFAPPEGAEPLTLSLKIKSPQLRFDVIDNEVRLFDRNGEGVLKYSDLNVWDANNQKLEAAMVFLEGNRFAIVVDDRGAAYPILVDPLTNPLTVLSASTDTSAQFGWSVAGYGSDDTVLNLVVGAPFYDTGGPGAGVDAGKVFVFSSAGGSYATSPSWTVSGTQEYMYLGASVAWSKGNFTGNQSGSTIAIGASGYDDPGYTDNGKVFVYDGSGNSIWSVSGPPYSNAYFGNSVCWLRSVDDDFSIELAVGAPGYSGMYQDGGAVYLYKGGSNPDQTPDWSAFGANSTEYFGFSVAEASGAKGSGDNETALIIGAPYTDSYRGYVYVYYKSGSNLGSSRTSIAGANYGDNFGWSVAGGYDQNADGFDDIVVGAPFHDNGESDEGKAYLFRGSSSGISTSSSWTMESNQPSAKAGWGVALGDLNNDGKADILVGAPYFNDTTSDKTENGRAYSYITDSSGAPVFDVVVVGLQNYDHLGKAVAYSEPFEDEPDDGAWIIGVPDSHNGSGSPLGGTVLVYRYAP